MALLVAGAFAVGACSGDTTRIDGESSALRALGQIGLRLVLPDGSSVSEVRWTLLRDGVPVQTGLAPVQADGTASVAISEVPAGAGYQLDMQGTSHTGGGSCVGSSPPFEVVAGETVAVSLTLQCDSPVAAGTVR